MFVCFCFCLFVSFIIGFSYIAGLFVLFILLFYSIYFTFVVVVVVVVVLVCLFHGFLLCLLSVSLFL